MNLLPELHYHETDGMTGWLLAQGVPGLVISSLLPLYTVNGVRARNGRFDPNPEGAPFVYIEDEADFIFWNRATGELASWDSRTFALGEAVIDNPATLAFGCSLNIFDNPLDWLRAKRDGIVIIDWRQAFDRLRDLPRVAVAECLLPTYDKHMRPTHLPKVSVIPENRRAA